MSDNIHAVELFIPDIKYLIKNRDFSELKSLVSEINPIDLAEGLHRFPVEEQLLIFKLLNSERAVQVFEECDLEQQQYFIQHMEDSTLTPLLEDIPADITADLFKELPEKMVRRLTRLMKRERVKIVENVMELPPNSAGAFMQTEWVPVSPEMTARATLFRLQASARLRKGGAMHTLFVTNDSGKLVGALTLSSLVGAPPDIKIRNIMAPVSLMRIYPTMDQEEAAKIFSRYKLLAAPVVDEQNRLIGVLTVDDIIEVIQEETTEDIQKLGGIEALEDPYFNVPFLEMIRKRASWLCLLFVGETLTATAMGFFEHAIAQAVMLALFIPLIISSGGNSGSQAATLIVRSLSLKEVTIADWWKVMRREAASGLVLGLILGTIGFLRIFVWAQFSDLYGPHYLLVASTVGISLVLIVMWGTLAGSLLPILLRRLGLDPATASAPFVATLIDVTGLIIYFGTATILLKGTLL